MKTVKVALVEFGGSHDECLLTQIEALREINAHITLVTNKSIYDRNVHLHPLIDETCFVEPGGRAIGDLLLMRKLVRYLREKEISKVVFNTAQGGHVRNLALLMPRSIECYGIIHTVRKFNGSSTQRVINKAIKSYLVLSDDLLKKFKAPEGISTGSFYPVCYPSFEEKTEKPAGETWISITGGVENRRKDLEAVIGFIESTPATVKFFFLGKTDVSHPEATDFLRRIGEKQLTGRVTWYPEFVSQEVFDSILNSSDFLLPLIHPGTPSADEYISNQISGAFTLAYAYRIPLLIHEAYREEEDLSLSSAFYSTDSFPEDFRKAQKNRQEISMRIAGNPKWRKPFQFAKYRGFLGLS